MFNYFSRSRVFQVNDPKEESNYKNYYRQELD